MSAGYPTLAGSVQKSSGSTTTSMAITYPASIAAGDLLICVFYRDKGAAGVQTFTWPAGWTVITGSSLYVPNGSQNGKAEIAWKVAAGTETGTFTITGSDGVTNKYIASCWRMTGWYDTGSSTPGIAVNTATKGSGVVVNIGSATPAWTNVRKTTYVGIIYQRSTATAIGYPSNTPDMHTTYENTPVSASGNRIVTASAEDASGSFDIAACTGSTSAWTGQAIMIEGSLSVTSAARAIIIA